MRLRLKLLNEDLADMFSITFTHCSSIFKTWIRLLGKTTEKLGAWLPKESAMETMPRIFKTTGHGKWRCIINWSEVFIVRPKKLNVQAATWSDNKSQNIIKILISISPTGFLTNTFGGRTSDKFICGDGAFLTGWLVMMKLW